MICILRQLMLNILIQNQINQSLSFGLNKNYHFPEYIIILGFQRMSLKGANQFVIRNGKLVPRTQEEQAQKSENYRVIGYEHTVRVSQDDYFNATIRQYKAQLQELKKNHSDLQKEYQKLLEMPCKCGGLSTKNMKPRQSLESRQSSNKNKYENRLTCDTEETPEQLCQQSLTHSDVSKFTIREVFNELDEAKRKLNRVTDFKLNEQISKYKLKPRKTLADDLAPTTLMPTRYTYETEPEQEEQQQLCELDDKFQLESSEGTSVSDFEQQLFAAFEQIRELRDLLQQSNEKFFIQLEQTKKQYQNTIKKLEQVLQRERNNNRTLNSMITRMRGEINCRDELVREIVKLKKIDRGAVERLVKQFQLRA